MHLAAELARTEVVEMLLKSDVDLTLKDRVRIHTFFSNSVVVAI